MPIQLLISVFAFSVPVVKDQILTTPLDLSSPTLNKRIKRSALKIRTDNDESVRHVTDRPSALTTLLCSQMDKLPIPKEVKSCQMYRSEVYKWTVGQVCDFVNDIDICAEYVQVSGNLCLFCQDHLNAPFLFTLLSTLL